MKYVESMGHSSEEMKFDVCDMKEGGSLSAERPMISYGYCYATTHEREQGCRSTPQQNSYTGQCATWRRWEAERNGQTIG